MTSILELSLTKPGVKSDETPNSTLHSPWAQLFCNAAREMFQSSADGIQMRGRPQEQGYLWITDLVDVVLRQMLEHHAHVEVVLHRGPVQPHVQLPAQSLGLGPGVRFYVDCEDTFSFFSADQTVANVSLMQKCLNEIACYFAFLIFDFLSRSKSLISR